MEIVSSKNLFSIDSYQIDSIAEYEIGIICAQSKISGNIWDGRVSIYNFDSEIILHYPSFAAASSIIRFATGFIVGRDDGKLAYLSQDMKEIDIVCAHDDLVNGISCSKKPDLFASIGWDGCLSSWVARASDIVLDQTSVAHDGIVYDVSFSPFFDTALCTSGKDGFLRLWDARSDMQAGCVALVSLPYCGTSLSWDTEHDFEVLVGTRSGDLLSIDTRVNKITKSNKYYSKPIRRIRTSTNYPGVVLSSSEDSTMGLSLGNSPVSACSWVRCADFNHCVSDCIFLKPENLNGIRCIAATSDGVAKMITIAQSSTITL